MLVSNRVGQVQVLRNGKGKGEREGEGGGSKGEWEWEDNVCNYF